MVIVSRVNTYNLLEQLSENADEFIIYELTTFHTGFLQPLNLLLDDDFKGLSTNKK